MKTTEMSLYKLLFTIQILSKENYYAPEFRDVLFLCVRVPCQAHPSRDPLGTNSPCVIIMQLHARVTYCQRLRNPSLRQRTSSTDHIVFFDWPRNSLKFLLAI